MIVGLGAVVAAAVPTLPALAQVTSPPAIEQPALEQDSDTAVDAERGVSVNERPRPDFEPEGLRIGTFLLFPQLGLEERYNTNIYAQRNDAKDDFISRLQPELRLESDCCRSRCSLVSLNRARKVS